jgi:superfamily II DNA or RNA helicase
VVLPTGSGKSHVAVLAINATQRSTLVVAPTLDLVRQWYDLLRTTFEQDVGIVGGGSHTVLPLTVTTYDSAYLHMENFGNRFGLIVFDECHHLPGESYALTARLCLAPYRLGLTATPERADGREELLNELIGETVYQQQITDLSGEYLADYETERIVVDLSEEERAEYESSRAIYLAFVRSSGIRMGSPRGFSEFIMRASRNEKGKEALTAYRRQKTLALAASGKLKVLEHLLHVHRSDRTIVFTQDNATAYTVSQRFLIPVITHQTKVKERSELLEGFHAGRYRAIVTSKVLNEGVDIPSAGVAIVLSGSGSVMEHVQRLGRILRRHDDKRAVLYEIIAKDTSETSTSDRRREHTAYKGRPQWRRR